MLLLMLLTSITLYLVAANMALLAAGWRSLPSQSAGAALLGATSLSSLGVVGVVIEVVVIAYLFLTRCPGSRYFGGGGYVLCFVCGGVDALSWWWWWLCDVSW